MKVENHSRRPEAKHTSEFSVQTWPHSSLMVSQVFVPGNNALDHHGSKVVHRVTLSLEKSGHRASDAFTAFALYSDYELALEHGLGIALD